MARGAGKGTFVQSNGGSIAMASAGFRRDIPRTGRWRHCITMSISPLKMRWCRWRPHLDVRFVSTDGDTEVITEARTLARKSYAGSREDAASVAAFPRVREALLRRQRAFREAYHGFNRRCGRDMRTVVFRMRR